ncbi:MAG: hypothetical protein ACR2M6_02590 [Vampirovibrionia bacterium]
MDVTKNGDKMIDKTKILNEVPWTSIIDLADSLSEAGLSDKEIAKQIADFLDMILDFSVLVKGPAGEVLEAIDNHILFAAISIIIKVSKNGKQKRKLKRTEMLKSISSIKLQNLKLKK